MFKKIISKIKCFVFRTPSAEELKALFPTKHIRNSRLDLGSDSRYVQGKPLSRNMNDVEELDVSEEDILKACIEKGEVRVEQKEPHNASTTRPRFKITMTEE